MKFNDDVRAYRLPYRLSCHASMNKEILRLLKYDRHDIGLHEVKTGNSDRQCWEVHDVSVSLTLYPLGLFPGPNCILKLVRQ